MSKKVIILIHILFWILFELVPELPTLFSHKPIPEWIIYYNSTSGILNILNFYICYFIVKVNFLNRKQFLRNLLLSIIIIIFFIFFRFLVISGVYYYMANIRPLPEFTLNSIVTEVFTSFLFTMLAFMLRYTIDWVKTSQKQMELERQKQMSELALLRSQINPHFLFNTLNNIYSLVYQKSEKAPQVVLKLSEIMRYMLYESNTEKVLLSKEIEYLKGFIEIQKLRLKNEDAIKFEIKGNIENVFIAPMLLIPFVENAFKHGDKGAENIINIKLSIENKTLVFEVINPVKNIEPIYKDNAHGIGLQNIQRRLNLIYPSTHLLEIKKQNDLFKVTLKIEKL